MLCYWRCLYGFRAYVDKRLSNYPQAKDILVSKAQIEPEYRCRDGLCFELSTRAEAYICSGASFITDLLLRMSCFESSTAEQDIYGPENNVT